MRFLIIAALALTACSVEPKIIKEAKAAAAYNLVDPDSAKFRSVEIKLHGQGLVCGEINGINRAGAYAGYEKFAFQNGRVAYASDEGGLSTSSSVSDAYLCR